MSEGTERVIGGAVDLNAMIRLRQERRALHQAIKLARDGAEAFRPAPGQMVGYRELQLRIIAAIEAGIEGDNGYNDPVSTVGALLGSIATMFGATIGALPDGYPIDPIHVFNAAGNRVLPAFKAGLTATHVENHPDEGEKKGGGQIPKETSPS